MYRSRVWVLFVGVTLFALVHTLPPDKNMAPLHIIKTRSIDLNNAHGLAMESRLERTIEPTAYRIQLEPYLEDGLFKGHVAINLTWLERTDEITLHAAHNLEISDTVLMLQTSGVLGANKASIRKIERDPRKPLYKIYLHKSVDPLGTTIAYLEMNFEGKMDTTHTEAFFKTSYKDENERESIIAATQLRPTNARRMFPCFDEPDYKATFELSVVRPRNMIALSNVPVASTEDIPGEPNAVWDHFEKTRAMPTYAFGLVIAELKQLGDGIRYKDHYGNNIELRVWGREEFLPALEGLPEKLKLVYSEVAQYLEIPLPLSRLDIVALPNYQGVKPADNWGLIVFKESDLTSRGYLQLSQEIAYQWIGSLTTPSWWVHAHLNKALVGYIAAETVFKINNGSEMEGKWPMTILYSLYYEFSKRFPHSRITGMKQETACTKIELLLRMFNYTLGTPTFKKAIRNFITSRQFRTFTDEDVWEAMDMASDSDKKTPRGLNLEVVVKSWLDKDRLPFITAERIYDKNALALTQKVFLRERPHDVPNADSMIWIAPLVVVTSDQLCFCNTTPTAWLATKSATIYNLPGKDEFVIINPEEIAPYLVNYDEHNWNLISVFLQGEYRLQIPELTRAKLLHDAWNLAYAGELSFATAFNMTLFMKNERHHLVWDPIFTMIDHIGRQIDNSDVHSKFLAYTRIMLSPLYEELAKSEDNPDEEGWKKNLRSLTKTFLCKAGYKPCIREAQDQYKKWMDAPNPDEGNPIANQYICPVFKWGTRLEWQFGLERVINFPSSRKQSERTYLLKTLAGCPVDEEKILRLLNVTILNGNGNFTETDTFLILSMLTGSSKGYTTLFNFLSNNWDVLKEKYFSKTNLWDNLITSATPQFTTKEGLEMVRGLSKAHSGEFGSAEHIIENSLRVIKEEAEWSTQNLPVIRQWLNKFLSRDKNHDKNFVGTSWQPIEWHRLDSLTA